MHCWSLFCFADSLKGEDILVVRIEKECPQGGKQVRNWGMCRGFHLGDFPLWSRKQSYILRITICIFQHILARSDATKTLFLIYFNG